MKLIYICLSQHKMHEYKLVRFNCDPPILIPPPPQRTSSIHRAAHGTRVVTYEVMTHHVKGTQYGIRVYYFVVLFKTRMDLTEYVDDLALGHARPSWFSADILASATDHVIAALEGKLNRVVSTTKSVVLTKTHIRQMHST